jgi:TolB-like protein
MKKAFLATAILAVFVMSCGSTAPAQSGADELDTAIREASDYLNNNIPAGSKIVILNINSDSDDLSNYIIDELIANAVNDRIFEVVDRQQLDLIRAEQNFQFSGEVDDNLALDIGKFFGAQSIISGTLGRLGSRYRLTIRALEVQTARVQGQYNRNIESSRNIAELLQSGSRSSGTTTAMGSRTSGGRAVASGTSDGQTPASDGSATASGTTETATATPVTPAQVLRNGTYTLNPRPRVRTAGGQWLNMWISKVVVENRFITFYFESVERGAGSGFSGTSDHSDWYHTYVTLYNLDNENVYVTATGETTRNAIYPETIIFPRVNFNRFRMETRAYGRDKGFEEIILGEPDE